MDDSTIGFLILGLIISIVVLIVFFRLAANVKAMNDKLDRLAKISNGLEFIRLRYDGEFNYLREDRSDGEMEFLIANGYREEAKRMLLRKVWTLKSERSYESLYKQYMPYFEKLNLPFPSKEIFGVVSNPV